MDTRQRICEYLSRKHVPFTFVHDAGFAADRDRPSMLDWTSALDRPADLDWRAPPLVGVTLLFVDRKLAMLVLRAGERVDSCLLAQAFGGRDVTVADLGLLGAAFPDIDVPHLPPFGELWQMPVFVDETLTYEPALRFYAGNPHDILTIRSADFERLNQPVSVHVATLPATPSHRAGARVAVAS